MIKTAFITGISGQDGSLLAKFLLSNNYKVYGLVRKNSSKLNLKEISLTMNWKCTNPSDFNFTIKNQVYDVFLNDVFVRKVGSSAETEVYGRGTSIIPTNIYITTEEVLKLGKDNLAGFLTESGRKKTKLKVTGTLDIATPLFTLRKLPFFFEDTLQNIMNY